MIQIFEIDSQGNILDSQIEQDDFQETTRLKAGWTGYLLKPIYDFSQSMWIESATNEELNPPVEEVESSEEIKQLQTELLEQKERADRLEDTVLALADMVLG